MHEEIVTLPARDGYQLGAQLILPSQEPLAAIVLNGGTGIPRQFYRRFAAYAASCGYAVLLYDYRGIGASRPPTLRGFAATMRDWGEKDMAGALDWLHQRFAGVPLYAVGHSVGGQLLGLMPNHHLLDGAALIAVSTGYWAGMPWWYGLFTLGVWFVGVPLSTKFLGYFPAKRLRFGEDLPSGVAREWGQWCLRPRYLADFFGTTIQQHCYDTFRSPMLALSFSDDPIATSKNVKTLLSLYQAAPLEHRPIQPAHVGLRRIGHLGFFRQQSSARLWPLPLEWFKQHSAASRQTVDS